MLLEGPELAVRYLAAACDAKSAAACARLARLYESGAPKLASDPKRARPYRAKACDLGDRASCKR
jgi:TPR repeat protein